MLSASAPTSKNPKSPASLFDKLLPSINAPIWNGILLVPVWARPAPTPTARMSALSRTMTRAETPAVANMTNYPMA